MGEISQQTYIRFIEREIARLSSYEGMARQQTEQLAFVDTPRLRGLHFTVKLFAGFGGAGRRSSDEPVASR